MGRLAGVKKALDTVKRNRLTAYHGTPHEVDQFSMDKIGTGEGAQAYGHGLYFAENPEVGRQYRDSLTSEKGGRVEIDYNSMIPLEKSPSIASARKNLDKELFKVNSNIESAKENPDLFKEGHDKVLAKRKTELENKIADLESKGNLYKVELDIDPDTEMLDWDLPISDELRDKFDLPQYVGEGGKRNPTGKELVSRLSVGGGKEQASKTLSENGFKGIRYKAGQLSGLPEGATSSYNFVVFDDSLISIAEKNGIPFEQVTNLAKQKGVTNQQALSMLVGGSTGIALMGGGERAEAGVLTSAVKTADKLREYAKKANLDPEQIRINQSGAIEYPESYINPLSEAGGGNVRREIAIHNDAIEGGNFKGEFDINPDVFHGTAEANIPGGKGIEGFNTDRVFTSKSHRVAENEGGFLPDSFNETIGRDAVTASNERFQTSVYPLRSRGNIADKETTNSVTNALNAGSKNDPRVAAELKKQGYEGMTDSNYEIVDFNPSNIRSKNAAFDPQFKNSSNLLGQSTVKQALGAGGVGLLGMGMLAASDKSEASFIGSMAKTFNTDALKKAQKMAADGASRDEIWKATGDMGSPTFKDVDGHWKQEIDDSGFKFNQPTEINPINKDILTKRIDKYKNLSKEEAQMEMELVNFQGTPEEYISSTIQELTNEINDVTKGKYFGFDVAQHPELSAAYPEINYGQFQFKNRIGFDDNVSGAFDPRTNEIILKPNNPENRSILSHERQHYIQEQEGFGKGGNTEDVTLPTSKELAVKINEKYARKQREIQETPEYKERLEKIVNEQDPATYPLSRLTGKPDKNMAKRDAIFKANKEFGFDDLENKRLQEIEPLLDDSSFLQPTYNAYQRLSGEAEARNVQSRLEFPMELRKQRPPWETLDVPENELIVRGNSGVMESRGTPKQRKAQMFLQKRAKQGSPRAIDKLAKQMIGTQEVLTTVGSAVVNDMALSAGALGTQFRHNLADGFQRQGMDSAESFVRPEQTQKEFSEENTLPQYLPKTEEGMDQAIGLGNVIDETVDYWKDRPLGKAVQYGADKLGQATEFASDKLDLDEEDEQSLGNLKNLIF